MVSVHGVTISEIASFFSDILVIWATGSWSFSGLTPKSPVARRATGSQNSVARRQNPVAMAPGHPLSFNAGVVICVNMDLPVALFAHSFFQSSVLYCLIVRLAVFIVAVLFN